MNDLPDINVNVKMTQAERLTRIETLLFQYEKEISRNGTVASDGLQMLSDKLDAMDAKWDTRFQLMEAEVSQDAKELQALKNKGAGILAALGVVATATATVFSNFFSAIKHTIFG